MYRTLFSSPWFEIGAYRCRCGRGGKGPAEFSGTTDIVFVRRGVFCRHVGGQEQIADNTRLLTFQAGAEYRTSHPADDGDDCTVITLKQETLDDLLSEAAPGESSILENTSRPVTPDYISKHWALLRSMKLAGDPREVEEKAFSLALAAISDEPPPNLETPHRTQHFRQELVNEARVMVAQTSRRPASLQEVAGVLSVSPFYLSRIFREQAGTGFADYSLSLRLNEAARLLVGSQASVRTIAKTLGFTTASYFCERFRLRFGCSPAAFRRSCGLASSSHPA